MAKSIRDVIFLLLLHSSKTPQPIFMKLEIYTRRLDTTQNEKCQGAVSTWGSGQIASLASLAHERFFLSFLHHAHRSHLWTQPTHVTSLYIFSAKDEVPCVG